MKPILALTMGDINGVGPEVLAKALSRPDLRASFTPLVVGSMRDYERAMAFAPGCPKPVLVDGPADLHSDGSVGVIEGGIAIPETRLGHLDAEAGRCAAEWLMLAVRMAMQGAVDGIVTCPLNKEGINLAGYAFAGHTDIIADMTASKDYRMCLFAGPMRIVHITAHLPLAEALRRVTVERIVTSVRIARDALARLGMPEGRVAVAGLNPHAGEAGMLGREELDTIEPAVRACQAEGIACSGPYPPDTVFRRMREGEFDIVVAMYHDQGHIPMKLIAMDEGGKCNPRHSNRADIAGPRNGVRHCGKRHSARGQHVCGNRTRGGNGQASLELNPLRGVAFVRRAWGRDFMVRSGTWTRAAMVGLVLGYSAVAPADLFRRGAKWPVGPNPTAVIAADLNNDGLPDLVTADLGQLSDQTSARPANDEISILIAQKDFTFVRQVSRVGFGPFALAVANMDMTKAPDILVGCFHDLRDRRDLWLLRSIGTNLFEPVDFRVPDAGFIYRRNKDSSNQPLYSTPGLTSLVWCGTSTATGSATSWRPGGAATCCSIFQDRRTDTSVRRAPSICQGDRAMFRPGTSTRTASSTSSLRFTPLAT